MIILPKITERATFPNKRDARLPFKSDADKLRYRHHLARKTAMHCAPRKSNILMSLSSGAGWAKQGRIWRLLIMIIVPLVVLFGCVVNPNLVAKLDPSTLKIMNEESLCLAAATVRYSHMRGQNPESSAVAVDNEIKSRQLNCEPHYNFEYDPEVPSTRSRILSDLKSGSISLDCVLRCDAEWEAVVAQVHALDIQENWNDLALWVAVIGYPQDLSYYYLGQAAQGLGFHEAAIKYYGLSLAMTHDQSPSKGITDSRCRIWAYRCQDINLDADIPVLIKASEDILASQRQPVRRQSK